MNEVIKINDINVENMIYEIRGKQVMLDSDLAKLYKCSNGTKDINKAVNRNVDRFPSDFYFQLTYDEYQNLKFRFGTSSVNTHGGVRKLPYVFTEQGVAMLASVLRTTVASEVSIKIMRAFVLMKQYISNNLIEQKYINELVINNTKRIDLIESALSEFKDKNDHLFFEGQIYDAYSKILDIFKSCKKQLIIIDNYADNKVLDIIKNLENIKITIICSNKYINKEIISTYNKQYNNLKVIINNTFHDRYFIIDNKTIYHCGASINRIGYKTFSIDVIQDDYIKNILIAKIKSLN